MTRALFAVDLSEDDPERVLADGHAWLERLGARVDLLHVQAPLPPLPPDETDPELDRLLEAAVLRRETALRTRLQDLLSSFPAALRGEVHVARDARPADEIASRASTFDLVAVGTHGRRGAARLWLGSVAEKVVRTSPAPVLVVRPPAEGADPARVLVAVDAFDDASAPLVGEAARWLSGTGARLDLVHVLAPPTPPDPGVLVVGAAWAAEIVELHRIAQRRLAILAEALPTELCGTVRVERGEASAEVAAASGAAGLVVVGTHGRRGIAHAWLGSVAERIVRRADAPVLVLRPRA